MSVFDITTVLLRSTIHWLNGNQHTENEWKLKTKIVQYCLADMKAIFNENTIQLGRATGSEAEHGTTAIVLLERTLVAMKRRDRGAAFEAGNAALQVRFR